MEGTRDQPVGRELELESIDRFLAARSALPAGLVIEGPAGQGKTTLWREAVARATAAGYRTLSCRASGAEVGLLFGGLSDLLVGDIRPVLAHLPVPQRRALEVVLLLEADHGGSADPRAVAAGVLSLVRELVRDAPLLLAVDDVQWLDQASAMVLEYAARRLGDASVAFLTARRIRGNEITLADSAAPDVASTTRGLDLDRALEKPTQRLALGPLSIGALHRILRTRTGASFPRPLLSRIHDASGGNPFYALEIARAMHAGAQDWSAGEPIALSTTLHDLLVDRFATLDGQTRDALFVAAVASTPSVDLVERVVGPMATDALRPAVQASIISVSGQAIEFAHPLLATAASAMPAVRERRAWHLRLADAEIDLEARARHLALARPGPDVGVAAVLHAAAQHAASRGAPAAAGELFAEAIRRLPDDALAQRATWTNEAMPALRQAGDQRLARSLVERVIAEQPAGAPRSDALLALSRLVGNDPGGDARELSLIQQALDEAGSDPARRAAALFSREMWERHQDRLDSALPFAREALALAERANDPQLLAGALTRTADLEVLLGLASDPVAHFQRALAAGSGRQMDAYGDAAPAMLSACLIRAGRVDEARQLLLAARIEARAHGDEASLQTICLFLTELEWLGGDWAAARAYGDEGLVVAEQAESQVLQGALAAMLALVDASLGHVDAARSRAEAALATSEEIGDRSYAAYAQQVLGFLELSVGRPAAAHQRLATYTPERGIEGTKRISFIGDDIEALVLSGQVREAAALTDELERRGQQLHRRTLSATAARCRGLVAGADGDLDEAMASAEQAVALATDLRLPFERARALLVLGDVQRRAKRRRAARETLADAAAAFAALGATLWHAKAKDSLSRVGGRVRHEGLTPTEHQVAALVARGLTNKEVAAELYVTVRAVEANLSRIYAKLGIRSRTELAKRL